jgi:hypothetical protein
MGLKCSKTADARLGDLGQRCCDAGFLTEDPAPGAVQTGQFLEAAGIDWAATSARSASVLAPMRTEVVPLEIYVSGKTWSDVRRAALAAGLQEMDGGRLALRPFPTPAGAKLTETIADRFRSVLWPRTRCLSMASLPWTSLAVLATPARWSAASHLLFRWS